MRKAAAAALVAVAILGGCVETQKVARSSADCAAQYRGVFAAGIDGGALANPRVAVLRDRYEQCVFAVTNGQTPPPPPARDAHLCKVTLTGGSGYACR
jgi:hypothetical protein